MSSVQLAARPMLRPVRKVPAQTKGPRGDMENFSMMRWLRAKYLEKANGTPPRRHAPFEAAWYATKAQNESIGQDGGYLAPEEWRTDYFKVLRGGLILNKVDTNIWPTKSRVSHIPFGAGDWTFGAPGENAAVTSADRVQGQITFTMRKDMAFSTLSRELVDDVPGELADQILKQDAASAMAHRIDAQSLFGTGLSGAVVGLVNQSFVNQISPLGDTENGGNGSTPTFWDVANGISTVRTLANTTQIPVASVECNGIVAAPRFDTTVQQMLMPGGSAPWLMGLSNKKDLPDQPRFMGVANWVITSLVPVNMTRGTATNASQIVFGDWRYFVLLVREDFAFELTDQAAAFANNQYQVKVYARYDAQAIYPFAFAVMSGVLP